MAPNKGSRSKNPTATKDVTLLHAQSLHSITIAYLDSTPTILNKVRAAIGAAPTDTLIFHRHSQAGPRIPPTYSAFKELVYVERAPDTVGPRKFAMLGDIASRWNVRGFEDILPEEMLPRQEPTSVAKAGFADAAKRKQPMEWSLGFVTVLHQLAALTLGNRAMAIGLLRKEADERMYGAVGSQNGMVSEVTTNDVKRAVAARQMEVAGEGFGNAVFAGGLEEAFGEIEEEVKQDEMVGDLAMMGLG
ncbi:hypothetical protein CC80DRAFT_596956 [Byssothecium circinans]|uniref:Uncharacterized protein n=1 Tax=Byssothecium circinans TaxID=147558 RepID=A0A6A5THI4_9PLEO|nr:hypothetical protein CC80DRAFT_596956 [Byssothecium circinans]